MPVTPMETIENYYGPGNAIPHMTGIPSGNNNITIRGNNVLEALPHQLKSKNLVQASYKVLGFYRKACRLMPFLIRIHDQPTILTPHDACRNLRKHIDRQKHWRNIDQIDYNVQKGWEQLSELELHYCEWFHYQDILNPSSDFSQGYSYLETKKYEGKSDFYKKFFAHKRSAEY